MGIVSKIAGIGGYVPKREVTNYDLEKMLETSHDWIVKRTGITKRYWAEAADTTSDLAYQASLQALERAQMTPDQIDMIILATVTPDHEFPGTACFLQEKLNCPGIPAIDVRQQCSGFVYSLSMADLYIKSGKYKNVLLVCAELHSKCLDLTPRGRNVSVLFGDGAGAVVLKAEESAESSHKVGVIDSEIFADGSKARELWCPAPGNGLGHETRLDVSMLEEGLQFPQMNGRSIFTQAVKTMAHSLVHCLESNQMILDDVDLVFFHQANLRICEAIHKHLELPLEKSYNTIQKFGNTTAATIPLGMSDAWNVGVLKPGMVIATVAFGSGFTWGTSLIRL